ncbi:MAG: beta-Ala-His dipeptidase [Lachnospiraceae bacterium]|nr:beta-Ala-His dipeptidase [Lachnospiraceae bacterium]
MFHNDQTEAPLFYFSQLAEIPRDSGKEKAVSDFLLNWALERGLDAYQDAVWNLIIKKPGSAGREAEEPVILQAHLDMVCEKDSTSRHNFETDPIPLRMEGDWLTSAAGTTLGSDDGIGVAYIMAVLADETLSHPPIEALLTVQEESTFAGAANVDWSLLLGKRLINLDQSVENEVLCGACGGTGMQMRVPLVQEPIPEDFQTMRVTISGLEGGHSGEDIHRGRGSAIALLARGLQSCKENLHGLQGSKADGRSKLRIVEFTGGTSRLAISREAGTVFAIAKTDVEACEQLWSELEQQWKKEYETTAKRLHVQVQTGTKESNDCKTKKQSCYTAESGEKILAALRLFPDGIQQMNGTFPGTVESSNNLGIVRTEETELVMTAEARGAYASTIEAIRQKVLCLADLLGGTCEFFAAYVPWEYRSDSPLRRLAMDTYREAFRTELKPVVVHAGIECGFFLQAKPDLDAISIGPTAQYFHSPKERLQVSSTLREWMFLKELLERM